MAEPIRSKIQTVNEVTSERVTVIETRRIIRGRSSNGESLGTLPPSCATSDGRVVNRIGEDRYKIEDDGTILVEMDE